MTAGRSLRQSSTQTVAETTLPHTKGQVFSLAPTRSILRILLSVLEENNTPTAS
jgi:hypothetical protein